MRAYFVAVALSIVATAACSSLTTNSFAARPGIVRASCTNSTSDAAILQRAINSSSPGSTIEIEGGICLLTTGISLLGDRTYAGGNTTGTVLKQDARMRYILASEAYVNNLPATGDPVAVKDLTIKCDGSGRTDGIIILNWQANVSRVDVNGCGGSGIVDTNTTANGGAIHNTSTNSRFDNNFISNSGLYGFEVYDSRNSVTDGYFNDNQVAASGKDAIHLKNAAGWYISGNHLYRNGQDGIYADRLYGTTISYNYIEDFGARQRSGTWYGITGTADGGIGSTISNNMIYNATGETAGASYVYAGVTGTNYGTGYLSVTGNVIVGVRPSDVGFHFDGGSQRLTVVSSGNEITHVGIINSDAPNVTQTHGM